MKVAVCIFGICRGNVEENLKRLQLQFGDIADFFYGTWTERKEDISKNFSDISFMTTDEPVIHYHPIVDTSEQLISKSADHAKVLDSEWKSSMRIYQKYHQKGTELFLNTPNEIKQHLGHDYMLRNIPEEYDMIIRTRFDSKISTEVNFSGLLQKSYEEKIPIGFSFLPHLQNEETKGSIDVIESHLPHERKDFLTDFMIFHRRDLWDHDWVKFLFDEKYLHRSEIGWYQILSQPYGSNHICYNGGIVLDKYEEAKKNASKKFCGRNERIQRFKKRKAERERRRAIDKKIQKTPTLRRGDRHRTLGIIRGVLGLESDIHLFDEELYKEIRVFQQKNGLVEDGLIGPKTLRKIYEELEES